MPPPPRIPDAESDVLSALYRAGSATARELREALDDTRPMAHATVVTLLGRLEARKLVSRRKADRGKAFVYQPTRQLSQTFGPAVSRLLHRAFGGRPAALVAALFETTPPTRAELEDLETLLADLRRRRGTTR